MREQFHVTYEIVTPESAEEGDVAERGYAHSNGGRDSLECVENVDDYAMDLRSALRICSPAFDCGRWFDEEPWTLNYKTGEQIRHSLHPPRSVTPSSYQRIKRLIGATH